jgi:DnaJ-class molecular chaperone
VNKTDSQEWLIALFATVDPTAQEDAPAAKRKTCPRCSGSGRLSYYSHVKGGECFACHGSGNK